MIAFFLRNKPARQIVLRRFPMLGMVLAALAALAALCGTATDPATAHQPGGGAERVELSLAWQRPQLVAGDQIGLAIMMDLQPNWHIYGGLGSGDEPADYIATEISVTLPEGWSMGAIQWPGVHEILFGPPGAQELIRAYQGRAIAFMPVTIPADAAPSQDGVTVSVTVSYQACDDAVCEMPTSVSATSRVRIIDPTVVRVLDPTPEAVAFFADYRPDFKGPAGVAKTIAPRKALDWFATGLWGVFTFICIAMLWMFVQTMRITTRLGYRIPVTVFAIGAVSLSLAIVLSMVRPSPINWSHYEPERYQQLRAERQKTIVIEFTADWCINCKVLERTTLADASVVAALNADDVAAISVDLTGQNEIGWSLLADFGSGGIPFTVVLRPEAQEPVKLRSFYGGNDLLTAIYGGKIAAVAEGRHEFDFLGWRFTLGANAWPLVLIVAAVAGFLLNFTPCVLPIVPIKILSLQAHAKNPGRCFVLGLVFGLGIVAAFAILGVIIGGLKLLDWGEMFSFWWVNAVFALLVFGMGLGMLGLFTFRLPAFVYMFNPQSDTARGSFAMGVFAAILSTPCTGPLIGAAVAWVALQPAWLGMSTFVVMGVGMAFPYVLLTAKPGWLARLPRTGPGSELIKQVMGLLLIAAAPYFAANAMTGLKGGPSSPQSAVATATAAPSAPPATTATTTTTTALQQQDRQP